MGIKIATGGAPFKQLTAEEIKPGRVYRDKDGDLFLGASGLGNGYVAIQLNSTEDETSTYLALDAGETAILQEVDIEVRVLGLKHK